MPATSPLLPDLRPVCGLPHIDPAILTARPEAFDDPEWMFEPKYDGFRSLVYNSPAGCEIRSRRDFLFARFGDLCERLAGVLGSREAILDGEVVALNRQGKPVCATCFGARATWRSPRSTSCGWMAPTSGRSRWSSANACSECFCGRIPARCTRF